MVLQKQLAILICCSEDAAADVAGKADSTVGIDGDDSKKAQNKWHILLRLVFIKKTW